MTAYPPGCPLVAVIVAADLALLINESAWSVELSLTLVSRHSLVPSALEPACTEFETKRGVEATRVTQACGGIRCPHWPETY